MIFMTTTIFTKPGCPYCAAAKADMESRGVSYVEHDVVNSRKWLDEMLKVNGGQRRVPTILCDGEISIGFDGS
jgi:glutaredoxin 3